MKKSKLMEQLSSHARQQLLELEREKLRRDISPLKLYTPYPYQKPFHYDKNARETLVIGGNRSGKTASCAMEFAWAVTGTHPVKGKYPKENGNAMVVGQNWSHIGRVIYPYLMKAGAFKIIRDQETELWRSYDFVKDVDRKEESKPSPPLIPERLIKNRSWVMKSANMISTCELVNGWTIWFFSSDADPPQGMQIDLAWIDEDINSSENWVAETQARLADRKGRLLWSAMPHSRNDALLGLAERAEKAQEEGKKHIAKYTFRFLDNPAIDESEKKLMIERWSAGGGEAEVRRRAEGDFVLDSMMVYPSFNMSLHRHSNIQIPEDWCRYMAVDPGHSVAAVLFAAIPPDEKTIVFYDELYIRHASAKIVAEEIRRKVEGHQFRSFLIDAHGGRLTDIGSGRSPQAQYSEELAALRVESYTTGSSFIPGCDDINAGIQAVRTLMYTRPDGTSKFRIIPESCPNLVRELKRYKFKVNRAAGMNVITDVPNKNAGEFHLVDCLRYIAAYEPQYHPPVSNEEKPWWYEWSKKRAAARNKSGAVFLAPQSYSFTFDA
jgi:hypothetical protein